jgi:hypothetical protein
MSKLNRNLLIIASVLLVLSAWTYRQSVWRADRFQRGQVFLPNMNPDEIATARIQQGEEVVTLRREGDHFVVIEEHGYTASNSAVNRLFRDLLEVNLEKEVGRGGQLLEELEIEPPTESTIEVALEDGAGKEMVRLRVGASQEEGSGRYIRRLDQDDAPIYLTSGGVFVSTEAASFLAKEIVQVEASQVVSVQGADFRLERGENGELGLTGLPAGAKEKTSEINGLESLLSSLSFDKVYIADDAEVGNLEFEQVLEYGLEDGSSYVLSAAREDDSYFLRIRGSHSVTQVAIARDEAEEQLREKAEMLSRADEIEDFNRFHGSWVYELGEWTGKKLFLRRSDLIDTEKT